MSFRFENSFTMLRENVKNPVDTLPNLDSERARNLKNVTNDWFNNNVLPLMKEGESYVLQYSTRLDRNHSGIRQTYNILGDNMTGLSAGYS